MTQEAPRKKKCAFFVYGGLKRNLNPGASFFMAWLGLGFKLEVVKG